MDDPNAPFPVVYISFPSAKDPDYLNRHPGTATIEIVAPAPYEWFEQWKGTTWGKRGEDYEQFKAELGERLMQHLYDKLPQLEGKVDYYEVSTPLSTDWFSGYQHGELYGLDHTPERLQQDWLGPRTAHSRPVADRPGHADLRRHRRDDGRYANDDGDGRHAQDFAVDEEEFTARFSPSMA